MYLLIIILKKSEFMAAQRARPILLNERFLVLIIINYREEKAKTFARMRVRYYNFNTVVGNYHLTPSRLQFNMGKLVYFSN